LIGAIRVRLPNALKRVGLSGIFGFAQPAPTSRPA